tara:strand:- start:201 stop:1163 length:963 start_codon:yes stop_codon:yes gene_type:complete
LNGVLEIDDLFRTLPVNPQALDDHTYQLPDIKAYTNQSFIAVLGHNYGNFDNSFFRIGHIDDYENIVNAEISNSRPNPTYNGFSIATFTGNNDLNLSFITVEEDDTYLNIDIGSIIIGTYYEMPHSPDLNLSLSYDYSGVKEITTRGGASLSNSFYSKPPMWGDLPAWEFNAIAYAGDQLDTEEIQTNVNYIPDSLKPLSRSGRRIWDLSFSYLDDGDVFGANQNIGTFTGDGDAAVADYDDGDLNSNRAWFEYGKNLLGDDNFYSQVIHKTNGGQLPFIFQPNKDDNTNFAIAKIDSGFTFKQVANGVYNVKMKIREVW